MSPLKPFYDPDLDVYWSRPGLGSDKWWRLPDTHPFFRAACYHDSMYDLMRSGKAPYPTSKEVDLEFFAQCLEAARDDVFLQMQAHFFYGIVRAWGGVYWIEVSCYEEYVKRCGINKRQAKAELAA